MFRLYTIVLAAALLHAQPAKKKPAEPQVPPAVDAALRARVTEFLNYHVTGEFRKAEALVAEDTKDAFYNRAKPRYIGCKGISSITYSDHFTKAYVTALCTIPTLISAGGSEQSSDDAAYAAMMGPPTVPLPSMWKIENGKWCYYLDKDLDRRTPFGVLPPTPTGTPIPEGTTLPMVPMPTGMAAPTPPPGFSGTPAGSASDPGMIAAIQAASHVPVTAASLGKVPEEALHHVKIDPEEVTLKAGASATVKISNDAEDGRMLMLLGQLPGVEAKLQSANIKGGESTTLVMKAADDAKGGTLNLVVATTGEMLPIKVTVK